MQIQVKYTKELNSYKIGSFICIFISKNRYYNKVRVHFVFILNLSFHLSPTAIFFKILFYMSHPILILMFQIFIVDFL